MARDNVIDICLVELNTYGNSPKKLFINTNINKVIRIIVNPFLLLFPKIVLSSLLRVILIFVRMVLNVGV